MTNEEFKQLKKIASKEVVFTEEDIANQCLIVPRLFQRYLDVYTVELEELKIMIAQKEKKHGKLYKYYKYEDDIKWTTREEINSQIRSNDEYYKILLKCEKQEVIVSFLNETIDNIKKMSFNMKNYIEIKKFLTGRDF